MKKIKQRLLAFDTFVRDGSVKLKNDRKRLLAKAKQEAKKTKKRSRVYMESEQKMVEEEKIREGARGWRDFMANEGISDASSKRPDLMYLAYGEPPDGVEASGVEEEK
jgi:hypothetical protein